MAPKVSWFHLVAAAVKFAIFSSTQPSVVHVFLTRLENFEWVSQAARKLKRGGVLAVVMLGLIVSLRGL